jgi:peptidyl-prolyl cis-trans isomerase D
MLKQLSRLERTRSIIIVGFAVLMAVSLVFFYAPGRNSSVAEPSNNTTVVAKVGRDEITVAQVSQRKENYLQMFGGRVSITQLGGYSHFVDGLVRERVVVQEAIRLGLGASDAELADKLRKQFVDASGQFIGYERYKERITAGYGDVETFEKGLRDEIAQDKLRAFVTSAIKVSDEEVQEDYKRTHATFSVSNVVISADKLAAKIQPSDDELKTYYDAHKADFNISEVQKKIRYVFIDQAKSGEKLQITDQDLHKDFDGLDAQAKQAGVKVQQIFLRVAHKDLDAQVEQKCKDLIAKIYAASPDTREKVFSDLARGNSEDPATAKNGGWLAKPYKRNPNKIDGLYDRTLDMKPGDVSDVPIRYLGNWYILRRGEAVQKTFEEAKPDLMASARNRKGYTVAANLAQRAQNRLKETKDPQKVAQEFAAEANMAPAEMVRETPFIVPDDDVPNIGRNQQFEAAIAPLKNVNDFGEPVLVKGGFALTMLVDKKDPHTPEFDEVKTKVATAVKTQRAKDQLEQKAKEIAASVNSVADLKAAAEKAGFEVATETDYKLGSPLGKAGTSPAVDEALYALKVGEVTKTPLKLGDNWVILGVTERKEADLTEFAKQRDQLTQTMLTGKQSQLFEDYIGAVQQRMKQEGRIKVNKEVIAELEASEPEVVAPPRPQFPMPGR